MTKIKICGVTNVKDARKCVELGVDYVGIVLTDSPRRAGLDAVALINATVVGQIPVVGVFARIEDLLRFDAMTEIALDYYQVYFTPPTRLRRTPRQGWIRSQLVDEELTQPVLENGDLSMLDFRNLPPAEMQRLLEDRALSVKQPTILAGNLSIDNVESTVRQFRPFGVDVARGTERIPGVKNHELLTRFVEVVRNADDRA